MNLGEIGGAGADLVEALPRVLAAFHNLGRVWLISQRRGLNLQNRLGYPVLPGTSFRNREPRVTSETSYPNWNILDL